MENQKYTLSEPTQEVRDTFLKEFQELLDKHSLYFEPVPQFSRVQLESPWEVKCQIFLQTKTEEIKSPIQSEDLK